MVSKQGPHKGVSRRLTERLRDRLRSPLGRLIRGSPAETSRQFIRWLGTRRPGIIVAVGDVVTNSLLQERISADVVVVDGRSLRAPIELPRPVTKHTVLARNPPGTITAEAWAALNISIGHQERCTVVVEGEEDLLVLPAVMLAPIGSLVLYGQPGEGLVVVDVTEEKKLEIGAILDEMEEL